MSNFLIWQSAYSELYFCDAYWPAFREIGYLGAAIVSVGGKPLPFGKPILSS